MGLKRSRLELEPTITLVSIGLLALVANAQLDYRPGPPYPDSNTNSGPGYGNRVKIGGSKLPLVTPDILRTLNKAFGAGVPVYPPSRQTRTPHSPQNSYVSSSPIQIRYPRTPTKSFQQQYDQPPSAKYAETAHVYFSQDVQKPMPNVIVKFQQSPRYNNNFNNYNHIQPIQQYSQLDPVVHQSVQVVQYSGSNQNQHAQPIQSGQSQTTHSAVTPGFSQSPQQTRQPHSTPAFRQGSQSQSKSPSTFSLNLEFPPKKWRQLKNKILQKKPQSYGSHRPSKTYKSYNHATKGKSGKKSKPLHTQAFPVFTVIGRGLDGLNAVRRGVKKGTGSVVASGVQFGGKLAGIGAGVVAKVIKVASSI